MENVETSRHDLPQIDQSSGKQAIETYSDKTAVVDGGSLLESTDDWNIPERVAAQQFFVQIDHNRIHTMVEAFEALEQVMLSKGMGRLILKRVSWPFWGRAVGVGQIAIMAYKGRPKLIVKPGRYVNLSLSHSWLHHRNFDLTRVHEVFGLTFAQVGQSEAMVCLDPNNQVFVVRNGGFAAYGSAGTYKVVEIVDTLNLGDDHAVIEIDVSDNREIHRILGYKKEVKHVLTVGGRKRETTIATFFNVPAQNAVVIQNGSHLIQKTGGQHVITNPRATFRGFFTLGERQRSFRTEPAYTLEGVPVVLHVNLRYRVIDPIKLTMSYETAFQALKNPAQSAVNAVVSRLSYQQFMRAKKVQGDIPDVEHLSWLEAFKQECMADLASHAEEYGVQVLSFDVLDRRLEGKLGEDLEKQAESVLKNQMQSTQIGLQNRNNTETEQGKLEVAGVRARQVKTEADASYLRASKEADAAYYQALKEADAEAETIKRLAQANADANRIETEQSVRAINQLAAANARAIKLQGEGYATVSNDHARRMQLEDLERQKFTALPSNATIFVGGGGGENTTVKGVKEGYAWAQGMSLSKASREDS